MSPSNPFSGFAFGELFESLLPDFVLAFALFTALAYAVLGKRFDHQRSALAASAAIGLALSVGLVWWEQGRGLSIRDLGPLAIGFALLVLGCVMFQAIRQTGGGWAGAGIGLGTSLVVAWILGVRWPVAEQIIQTVITVALIVGILAFMSHHTSFGPTYGTGTIGAGMGNKRARFRAQVMPVRHEIEELQEDHVVSDLLGKRLRDTTEKATHLYEHPRDAGNVLLQIQRMLPAEGWLTERMAQLREKAYRLREGHVARIEEIQGLIKKLPPEDKRKAAEELATCYKELGLDLRLDRLDKAVAANEVRIRELTKQAESYLAANDYRRLHDAFQMAAKLQKHNSRLFKIMNRTEARLQTAAKKVATKFAGVTRA